MKAIRIDALRRARGAAARRRARARRPGPGRSWSASRRPGVNFIDVYHRTGLYPNPLPLVPGLEGAGVVAAVGPRVAAFREGDRVAWASVLGSYAEQRAPARAERAVAVPRGPARARPPPLMLQGMTAHYLCTSTFPLAKGHTCLVHAAAGGVGLLLVQMAKRRGARVIGTVAHRGQGRARARGRRRRGDPLHAGGLPRARSSASPGGRGVDVVYDWSGRTTAEKSLDCLVPRGMMVFYGNASGPVAADRPARSSRARARSS